MRWFLTIPSYLVCGFGISNFFGFDPNICGDRRKYVSFAVLSLCTYIHYGRLFYFWWAYFHYVHSPNALIFINHIRKWVLGKPKTENSAPSPNALIFFLRILLSRVFYCCNFHPPLLPLARIGRLCLLQIQTEERVRLRCEHTAVTAEWCLNTTVNICVGLFIFPVGGHTAVTPEWFFNQ